MGTPRLLQTCKRTLRREDIPGSTCQDLGPWFKIASDWITLPFGMVSALFWAAEVRPRAWDAFKIKIGCLVIGPGTVWNCYWLIDHKKVGPSVGRC